MKVYYEKDADLDLIKAKKLQFLDTVVRVMHMH